MTPSDKMKSWHAEVPRSTRGPTLFGFAALALAIGGFGVWGNLAPIAGAIVTSGVFVTTGQNKVIQHYEGGVIKEIIVREGDVVEAGATLLMLDETTPRAELRRLELRHARLAAIDARLQAEANDADAPTFPPDLLQTAAADPEVASIVEAQRLTFNARRANLRNEIATLRSGIDALEERITGGRTQLKSVDQQMALIQEELDAKALLLRGGMIRKSEVLALQRARANLQGEVGRLVGEVGDSKERIARINEQIHSARSAAVKAAVEQMHENHAELADVRERMRSASRIVDRVRVTTPVKGVVVKQRYFTAGGVIEPGKPIMEIVPLKEDLVLEVHVRPQDIDNVRVGQSATVRLSALSARVTPMIGGKVVYVSADAVPDDKNPGQRRDIYIARVTIDHEQAASIKGFEPTSGMPAEVYITTAERTFLEYLLQPLKDSMSRAFRET